MFFHATALTGGPGVPQEGAPRPELQEMVRPGQQVEFSIQDSDGRLLAADVRTALFKNPERPVAPMAHHRRARVHLCACLDPPVLRVLQGTRNRSHVDAP